MAGAAGAGALVKFLGSQLYGVTARDPILYAAVIAVIAAVALAASAVPVLGRLEESTPPSASHEE